MDFENIPSLKPNKKTSLDSKQNDTTSSKNEKLLSSITIDTHLSNNFIKNYFTVLKK